jgi:protein-disulfide isomerase
MIRRLRIAGVALAVVFAAGCQQEQSVGSVDAEGAQAATGTAAARPPAGRDWTSVVAATPAGGFVMGNPAAPVKLVEYGSLTCSHCAAFAGEGAPALKANYVRTGKVSFEFRNFVRDPIDFAAALLTRCGGAKPYFKLTEQVFEDQPKLFERFQALTEAEQQRISALPQAQQMAALAKAGGLDQFMAVRGIPTAKANQCLADQKGVDQLLELRKVAVDRYQLQGTPTFLINDKVVQNTAEWNTLEPAIKAALR